MAADNNNNSVPAPQSVPMVDKDNNITLPWYQFLVNLWNRTGASAGTISGFLDTISSTVGAILYRAPAPIGWVGLNPGQTGQILTEDASNPPLPKWAFVTGANFGNAGPNQFFVGPPNGAAAAASFRAIVPADLSSLDGQYPGTTDGAAAANGNIGEIVSSTIASGGAVALATGVTKDITSIALGIGDWDIWANVGLTAASTTTRAWINETSVTDPGAPNSGAYLLDAAITTASVRPLGMAPLTLAAPATVYLSVNATFGGAVSAYGFLGARRRR